jgi:hypothetical protein
MEQKDWKYGFAKVFRILTIPPIIGAVFLTMLRYETTGIFGNPNDFNVSIVCLCIFPLLAYPYDKLVSGNKGRESQRKMAFKFTLIGYVFGLIYAYRFGSLYLKVLFSSYFLGVFLLTVLNKGLHIRASGHGASAMAPFLITLAWGSIPAALFFLALFMLSAWSSVTLGRHTLRDVLSGAACLLLSFLVSAALFKVPLF